MSFQMDTNFEEKFNFILKSLEPLINQILVPDAKFALNGKSHSARHLIKFLNKSLEEFANKSAEISLELSTYKLELGEEISKFRKAGAILTQTAVDFVADPLNAKKRILLGNQSKPVLVSLARILALFDLIDQKTLLMVVHEMRRILKIMKLTVSEKDFIYEFKSYGKQMKEFLDTSQNVIDCMNISKEKVELISARSLLAKQSLFLYSTTLVFFKQPKKDSARMLRDQVYQQTFDALDTIESILSRKFVANSSIRPENLLIKLIDLEKKVEELSNSDRKKELMNQLDDALRNITTGLNQSLFESDKIDSLVSECEQVRNALQHLLNSYQNTRNSQNRNEIDNYKSEFIQRNRSLRRQIRQLVVENFSFISNQPLDDLIEAAKSANLEILNKAVTNFEVYAKNLIDSSYLACGLSTNKEGIKLVNLAAQRLNLLVPLVIKSAQVLYNDPLDPEAIKNMAFFRKEWLNQVSILGLSIDDIISLNDFMALSESQILQDLNRCIVAMNNFQASEFKLASDQVIARTNRVCDLILMEIFNYEPCDFTDKIDQSVRLVRNEILLGFASSVGYTTKALRSEPIGDIYENEFMESSRLLVDSIRDLRNALLQIPQYESDNLLDETQIQQEQTNEPVQQEPNVEITEEINAKLNSFDQEKTNFDREVLKWDDNSNDIIVLSKQMCVLMIDMTNFTRGRGPIKSISGIIQAAKKISEIGTKLEKLCRSLHDECPQSESKKELSRYLNLIPLFCKQLNIGSKVKENIIDPESASSLLISSKNLMNTVASVVKTSYVASTKYTSKTGSKKPIIQWKMKPPELKPLVAKPTQYDTTGLVRKASKRNIMTPLKLLSEFEA